MAYIDDLLKRLDGSADIPVPSPVAARSPAKEDPAKPDYLTEAILSFGPALGGMLLGGSSGAKAAAAGTAAGNKALENIREDKKAKLKSEVEAESKRLDREREEAREARRLKERDEDRAEDKAFRREMFKAQRDAINVKPTAASFTAATFAQRLVDANRDLDHVLSSGAYDPTKIKTSALELITPEFLRPEGAKLYDQAKRNFINAVLRRESGATIQQPEFDSADKQYFPLPGDTPAVLEQKARNRQVALAGLMAEGAPAMEAMKNNLPAQAAAPQKASAETEMVRVISPDGKSGSIPKKNLEKALAKGFKVQNG